MDQFEIGGVSAFGGPETEPLTIANFDPGSFDIRKQETDLPRGDGVLVGSEYLGGGLWSFDLNAHGSTLAEVLAAAGELQRVWNDPARRVAGAVSVLRYQIDGRWRRVYGRPGRFAAPRPDYAAQAGIGSFGCDFRITRPAFYDDVEQQDVVGIVPATGGGFTVPFTSPIATEQSSAPRAGMLINRGDAQTPVTIRFFGPIAWPLVKSTLGWEIGLSTTLAYDDEVVVDPIAGTVMKNGLPAPGLLSRRSRIRRALLQPGANSLYFTGTDPTGTAKVLLSFRHAYSSL